MATSHAPVPKLVQVGFYYGATVMKIGFVTPNYYPNVTGGGELSLKLLAEELAKRHHTVIVFSFDSHRGRQQIDKIHGVTIIRYRAPSKSPQLLTLIVPVSLVMKEWEEFIDVYHLYCISPLPGGALYKMLGGKRNVVGTLNSLSAVCPICVKTCLNDRCAFRDRLVCLHVHDRKQIISSILYSVIYPVLTALSRNLDHYIALTNSVKQSHVLKGFDSNRIAIIPNFFERPRDSVIPASYNDRTSKSAIFNILYVGAVIREKGLGVLIRAFSEVSDKHSEARLTIVGSGEGFDDYVKMVEDLSLSDKVTFKGHVNDRNELKQIYLKTRVFVHPAICPDPFPRTLLEAMTFEIPTIVSNMGSLPEIVGSGGLVFESGNAENLAEKIEILIQNSEVRQRLSSNCKEVVRRFSPDFIPNKIVELYKTLIDSCGS